MASRPLLLLLLLGATCGDGGQYGYEANGADWGDACSTGLSQSPIDLVSPVTVGREDYRPIRIDYAPTKTFGLLDYHSVYKLTGSFGTLTAVNVDRTGNFTYSSVQFHFHAPSEHSLNGVLYPMELHIVHALTPSSQANPLRYAVLGVFFQEGAYNPTLAQFESPNATNAINLGSLFEGQRELTEYYMYKGSLTTPPCTETVNWYVYGKILTASKDQLDFFRLQWELDSHFAGGKGNNRAVMPLNGRDLLYYSGASALLLASLVLLY